MYLRVNINIIYVLCVYVDSVVIKHLPRERRLILQIMRVSGMNRKRIKIGLRLHFCRHTCLDLKSPLSTFYSLPSLFHHSIYVTSRTT